MPLNLQSLTNSSTSGDILGEIGSAVNSFEYVAALKNLATGSDALTDATQPVSVLQGTSIQGKGLYLPGTTGNYASVPDNNNLDGFGDFTLQLDNVTLPNWTNSPNSAMLIGKYTSNTDASYRLLINTTGRIRLYISFDGISQTLFTSSAISFSDSTTASIRVLRDGTNIKFYTSTNGEEFTQLGSDISTVNTALFSGTSPVEIGSQLVGTGFPARGTIERTRIWDTATPDTSNPVLDIDFTSNNITTGATSFTADSGQVVTINQSGDDFARISKGSHLIMDLVDDEYEFTTDAAIDGTIVVATTEGTYSAGISLDASTTYNLAPRGVAVGTTFGFMKNPVGYVITTEPVDESAIQEMENYFVSKGAAARSVFGSVTNFTDAWRGCSSITSFPLIDTSSVTNFYQSWRDCSSLVTFPLIDTSAATTLNHCWLGCSSLVSFPAIETPLVGYFGYAWYNCYALSSFPLIDTSIGYNFTSTWFQCESLTSFPLIDTSSAENLNSTWRGCTSLTAFPLINTSSVENFTATWQDCSSLSSFPLIDGSASTSNNRTWYGCESLSSFPAIDLPLSVDFFQSWSKLHTITSFPLIDVSSGKRFTLAWQQCTNLTTFPAGFFDNWSPPSLLSQVFNEAWGACTSLTPQSVENILVSIDTSGVHGTDTGASGSTQLADNEIDIDYDGGTLSSATTTAITNLKSKNWAIVINSVTQ